MANDLRAALDWLSEVANESAADTAILRRGADKVTITVVSQGDGGDGQYMTKLGETPEETSYVMHPPERGYCAFLVKPADYNIGYGIVKPARGDLFTVDGKDFMVTAPPGAECWKYHPNPLFQTWYWVHTKLQMGFDE